MLSINTEIIANSGGNLPARYAASLGKDSMKCNEKRARVNSVLGITLAFFAGFMNRWNYVIDPVTNKRVLRPEGERITQYEAVKALFNQSNDGLKLSVQFADKQKFANRIATAIGYDSVLTEADIDGVIAHAAQYFAEHANNGDVTFLSLADLQSVNALAVVTENAPEPIPAAVIASTPGGEKTKTAKMAG